MSAIGAESRLQALNRPLREVAPDPSTHRVGREPECTPAGGLMTRPTRWNDVYLGIQGV